MSDDNHDRVIKLADEISKIRADEAADRAKAAETEREATNMSSGARAGAELITLIIAGTAVGWGVDRFFHTSPAGLIFFVLVGICLGFYEVYRITK